MTRQFRCVDAAVIRVTACPSDAFPPVPDLRGESAAHLAQWREWLRQVWQHEPFADAVTLASPALARGVRQVCDGQVSPRRARRAVESTARYLLRLTTRSTPFGLFAGVAPVQLGTAAQVRWGDGDQAVARPDSGWLAAVIARLEARPGLLRQLPVVGNNLSSTRGDRLEIACQPTQRDSGRVSLADASIRHTKAVQTVMHAAQSPVTIGNLTGKLAAEFPGTPDAVIEGMLAGLVSCRFLITSLQPPMTVTDPLRHVLSQLAAAEADGSDNADAMPTATALPQIVEQLARHNHASSPGTRREIRTSVSRLMSTVCDSPAQPLAVDLRLGCSIVLPQTVVREAELAASALLRMTPHPSGQPEWQDYHARFVERYGVKAVIGVKELVDTCTGLGYPAGYRGSMMQPPARRLSARDRALLRLAQRAALDDTSEVVLGQREVAELAELAVAPGQQQPLHPQPHAELRFSLHAPTTGALDRGAFTLVVTATSRQAGTTTGRFLYLFDPTDRDRITEAFAGLPRAVPGAVLAQMSCPPLSDRTANLGRTPAVFPPVSIGEHAPGASGQIPLNDLAVTADAHALFLVSISRGQPVEPVMLNAVELRQATHPLARFLCEIGAAACAPCVPFDWGAASGMPFQPRVRHSRTVLRPACWNVSAHDLPPRRTAWREWSQAWSARQRTQRIPDLVNLGATDIRVRLDLTEPGHLALLRANLDRTGTATLTEAAGQHDLGWIGGRAHEIVLPLAAIGQPAAPDRRLAAPSHVTRHPVHMPGSSRWLSAKLCVHPDQQARILTDWLPSLLSAWDHDGPPPWWFTRHHEPEPHLLLCLRLSKASDYGPAARRIGRWAQRLLRMNLLLNMTLETYNSEAGRYGTGAAMNAAQAVFAADTAVSIAQLNIAASHRAHPHALIAASITGIAVGFTGSISSGVGWLTHHLGRQPGPGAAPGVRDQAFTLADPAGNWAALRTLPGSGQLAADWDLRRSALHAYRSSLIGDQGPEPDAVLACLLHLHHARMAGTSPDSERICLRLARSAALATAARNSRSIPSPSTTVTPVQQRTR